MAGDGVDVMRDASLGRLRVGPTRATAVRVIRTIVAEASRFGGTNQGFSLSPSVAGLDSAVAAGGGVFPVLDLVGHWPGGG